MELFLVFFNSFMVGFSGAIMPGPLLAVDIAETPRRGWRTGPIISAGHAVAEIGVVVVLAFGLTTVVENSTITAIIGVVGGVALILMGLAMGYDILKGRIQYNSEEAQGKSSSRLASEGITATLSNPYWFVWWGTTGLAFLVKSVKFGVVGPVLFYFGHILSDFVWYTAVSILIWKGKRLLVGRELKALILICALFLVYLGGSFILDGVRGTL